MSPTGEERKVKDPIAGQREAVNRGDIEHLMWPNSPAAPVKNGQIFKLRSCAIEITRVHRALAKGELKWRAEFKRHVADHGRLLKRYGGYTRSPVMSIPDPEFGCEPQAVPADYQRRISEEAALVNAAAQRNKRQRAEMMANEQRAADARPRAKRAIVRQIRSAERRMDKAA